MTHILEHRHLVISANIHKPPLENDLLFMKDWFKELVEDINMKILMGPFVVYSNMVGNRGFTGVTVIETSHAALHIWDEIYPAKMELDVYTCSPLDISIIFDKIKIFDPVDMQYIYLNRNSGIDVINHKNKPIKFKVVEWE